MYEIAVAFGPTAKSYIIGGEDRMMIGSAIPHSLRQVLDGQVVSPIQYASLGHHDTWFIRANNAHYEVKHWWSHINSNEGFTPRLKQLKDEGDIPDSVSMGHDKSFCWNIKIDESEYRCHSQHLADGQKAWVRKIKEAHGENCQMILGSDQTVVLLYAGGPPRWHSWHKVGHILDASIHEELEIRYLALSPVNHDWYFVQFTDGSVAWNCSHEIHELLIEMVSMHEVTRRKFATPEVLEA